MINFNPRLVENYEKADILSWYRKRLIYLFALICWVLVLPIAISNYLAGEKVLAAVTVFMLITLGFTATAFYLDKFQLGAITLFIFVLMIVIAYSMSKLGIYGIFWAYPTVLFIYFGVFRRIAKIYTAVFFVYFTLLVFYLIEFGTAIRSVIALVITILFTNIFLNIIEHLQERLVEQSNRDPLTGAFNRRHLASNLEEALERKRRSDTPASILLFDLDHFKSINDDFGHAVGDRVLKEFVLLIRKRRRTLDKLFRIGGEEFLLFLPDTPESGAIRLAEDIRCSVSTTGFIENRKVSVSIGTSELNKDESVKTWVKRGDDALYKAKQGGRNRSVSGKIHGESVLLKN